MIPGQLTDPGVNFTSVHGPTPVTVHMTFSLPRGNFEVTFFFMLTERKSCPRTRVVLHILIINVQNKFLKKSSKKHEKRVNVFKIHPL